MNINPGKYRTRDGGVAYVLAVLDVTYDPVVGYRIESGDGYTFSRPCKWETDGRVYITLEDEDDLVERIE